MSDQDALLRAIDADPDDDAPRLVYADWLDEHGDPERAAFVRSQCAYARCAPNDSARYAHLRVERLALDCRRDGWLADLPDDLRAHCVFRRGFVAEVACEVETFVPSATALAGRVPAIRAVRLSVATPPAPKPDERAAHLGLFHRLSELPVLATTLVLDLSDCHLGNAEAEVLAVSPHLGRLRTLELARNRLGAKGLAALGDAPVLCSLTSLGVSRNELGARAVGVLASGSWPALRALDLEGNGFGKAGAQALAASTTLERLESLNLAHDDLGDDGLAALATAPLLHRVRVLSLAGNGIGSKGLRVFASSKHLAALERLDLAGNPVDATGVRALVSSPHLPKLVELRLAHLELGDAVARALAEATALPKLRRLVLDESRISDTGAIALANSPRLKRLELLDLGSRNRIDDEGERALRRQFGERVRL